MSLDTIQVCRVPVRLSVAGPVVGARACGSGGYACWQLQQDSCGVLSAWHGVAKALKECGRGLGVGVCRVVW